MIHRLSKANLWFYALIGGFTVVLFIGGIEAACGTWGEVLMRVSYWVKG